MYRFLLGVQSQKQKIHCGLCAFCMRMENIKKESKCLSLDRTLPSMSYSLLYTLSAVLLLSDNGILCKDWNQVGLPCATKPHELLAFLSCLSFSFFSVSHPKPLRRLPHRRSPWPWPMMVTWICNQVAIPHKDTLGIRQPAACVQIVRKHIRHLLFARFLQCLK